ncbi:alpha/beta hydrolase [Clostridium perfringens]|uniref:Putative lysophospholipase n=1 Tax=Clostridium perfringens D str. JGS1721 TaxID=488537 RepID=B1V7T7_CLOPF|nr:alpha/beta hydrolase [Clostridium perfringens]EDT70129.1 putative lysophospholipase [Clostridium perfringens D str. JGS1721]PWX09946.1 alpha/beta hydrolase [Clostridium perfringens]
MCKTLNRKYIYKYGEKKEDVEIVENMLNRMRNSGTFKGENFANIYYEKYIVEESNKAIVICHGFSECIEKYHEIIYYFLNEGFSIYIMEHRGHGRSGCLSKSCNTQVEVESFDYYVKDLKTFLNEVVLKDKRFNNNLYLFAHSMGGAIGTIFLENNHGYFKKVILNSPMFRINTREYSHIKCKLIAKFLILIGKGESFIFGQKPFEEEENLEASGTSDKLRHGLYHKFLLENTILRRGGGSIHWYKEAARATDYLMKKRNIERIDTPILLFKSEFDSYVDTKFHDDFKKVAKDCELIEVKGSKHEGFFENDEILYDYLDKIFKFLEENN